MLEINSVLCSCRPVLNTRPELSKAGSSDSCHPSEGTKRLLANKLKA